MTVEYFNCVQLDSPDNTGSLGCPHWERTETRTGSSYPSQVVHNAEWLYLSQPQWFLLSQRTQTESSLLTEDIEVALDVWHALKHLPQVALPGQVKQGDCLCDPAKNISGWWRTWFLWNGPSCEWGQSHWDIQALWSCWGRSSCAEPRRRGWTPKSHREVAKDVSLSPKLLPWLWSRKYHTDTVLQSPWASYRFWKVWGSWFPKRGYSCDFYHWQSQGYYKCRN